MRCFDPFILQFHVIMSQKESDLMLKLSVTFIRITFSLGMFSCVLDIIGKKNHSVVVCLCVAVAQLCKAHALCTKVVENFFQISLLYI